MAEHPDVARLRSALEARDDSTLSSTAAALLEGLFADDVVWHGAGDGPGESIRGKHDVIAGWNALARQERTAPRIDVHEVYGDGNHGAAATEVFTNGSGTGAGISQATIFHFDTDGKVTELWGMPTDHALADAVGSGRSVPEHRNAGILLRAQQARQRSTFGPDDLDLMRQFLAENVLWYMGGRSQWAKTQPTSFDQVVNKFKMLKAATGGTLFFDIRRVFADDTHAVSFATLTADRPDRPDRHLNVDEVSIFHLDSSGRAFEFWGIPANEAERDAFWADDRNVSVASPR